MDHSARWYLEVPKMEYRGKHYTIVQGVGPHSWKWKVQLDEKSAKTGEAKSRDAAKNTVIWLIDSALASKKAKPELP
jgi:hypothetical protein